MFERIPQEVKIFEVGPRDGLQNEEKQVSTSDKVRLIQALAQAGLKHIEITSFVSPKWIPQLADGASVAKMLQLPPDVMTSALVPNLQGYCAAKEVGIKQIAFFMSATESHSKKNINKGIDQALATLKEIKVVAKNDGKFVRCYVSVVFVCPFEGPVKVDVVARIVNRIQEIGVDEISLGDTIGKATPNQVIALVNFLAHSVDLSGLALHFHDTYGTALANVTAGLDCGIKTFDSSIGGMGGCPYAPGAAGNLSTEDLIYLMHGIGIKTGVNLEKLISCGELAEQILGRKLPGRCLQASLAQRLKRA